MVQMKEKDKVPEEELSKGVKSNLLHKDFKVKIVKMLNNLVR